MIGDWVHSLLHDVDTTITDTEGPSDGVGDHRAYWLANMECFERHFPHEIDPIPLTEKILLDSGFKQVSGTYQYVIDERFDFIGVGLFRSYTRFTHEKYCVNRDDPDELEYSQDLEFDHCLYVHEFQHLLQLCGIEMDIVIK